MPEKGKPSLRDELVRLQAEFGDEVLRAAVAVLPKSNSLIVVAGVLQPRKPQKPAGKKGRNERDDEFYLEQMALLIIASGGLKRSRRDPNGIRPSTAANAVLKEAGIPDHFCANRARVLVRKFKSKEALYIAKAKRSAHDMLDALLPLCDLINRSDITEARKAAE